MFKSYIFEGRPDRIHYKYSLIDSDFGRSITVGDAHWLTLLVAIVDIYIDRHNKYAAKNISLFYIFSFGSVGLNGLISKIDLDACVLLEKHQQLQYSKYHSCVKNQILKEVFINRGKIGKINI